MTRVLVVAAGLVWAAVLFIVVGWMTFPGDAVAERLEWQVADASNGAYALDLGEVGPWWLGLSTDSIKVYSRKGRTGSANKLMMLATEGRMAAGLTSLMWRQPRVSGSVTLGLDGDLDYVVGTSLNEDGDELLLTELQLLAKGFPITELLAVLPGAEMTGTGKIDLDVEVSAPEGLSKANGKISISGSGMKLVQPVVMDFPLGRDVMLDDIEIEFDIHDGNAKIKRGRIKSDVANIDLTGSISLKDDPNQSNMDIRISIELDESMSMVKQMFSSSMKDGKLVYRCTGPISRIERACRADTGKVVKRRARPDRGASKATDSARGEDKADREERRKKLQDRLKARREKREKDRGGLARRPGRRPSKEKDEEDEDDLLDEEDEEDLPLDDEEDLLLDEEPPLDDGEFFEE